MTNWMHAAVWVVAAGTAAGMATGVANASKGLRDTPVTSTLGDTGTITSDGHGPYVNFTSRTDNVQSILQTSNTCCHDWILNVGDSALRTIHIDLQQPAGPAITPPFSSGDVKGRIIAFCHTVIDGGFPAIAAGDSVGCPMNVTWPVQGSSTDTWRLAFSRMYTDTELPRVTCLSADAGGCNHWTVDSTQGAVVPGMLVARLERFSSKGNTTPVSYGDYYMAFSFEVTRP